MQAGQILVYNVTKITKVYIGSHPGSNYGDQDFAICELADPITHVPPLRLFGDEYHGEVFIVAYVPSDK